MRRVFLSRSWLCAVLAVLAPRRAPGFLGRSQSSRLLVRAPSRKRERGAPVSMMVLDFVKKKSEELNDFLERRAQEDQETLRRFTEGLTKTRDELLASLSFAAAAGNDVDAALEKLEETLLAADLGFETTEAILADVKRAAAGSSSVKEEDVKAILRGRMVEVLGSAGDPALALPSSDDAEGPAVIVVLGSNGMGKTTTIGKLARRLRVEGEKKVLLAACDTFRAAAVEQLVAWGERADVDVCVPDEGVASPSAAAFKAMDLALKESYDVVIVDTSGRLANNVQLNEELKKITKTIAKKIPAAPHETLVVVDANVGRNAVDQARVWRDEVAATGLCVTKLDGTSRAGFVVGVVRDLGMPVKLVGVGETLDDLRDFDPEAFVDSLLNVGRSGAAEKLRLVQRFDALKQEEQQQESSTTALTPAAAASSSSSEEVGDEVVASVGGVPPTRPRASPSRGPSRGASKKKKKKAGSRRR